MKPKEMQSQIIDIINVMHEERIKFLVEMFNGFRNQEDNIRRTEREKLRYDIAINGVKEYFMSVEEWNDPNYKIGDLVE